METVVLFATREGTDVDAAASEAGVAALIDCIAPILNAVSLRCPR